MSSEPSMLSRVFNAVRENSALVSATVGGAVGAGVTAISYGPDPIFIPLLGLSTGMLCVAIHDFVRGTKSINETNRMIANLDAPSEEKYSSKEYRP